MADMSLLWFLMERQSSVFYEEGGFLSKSSKRPETRRTTALKISVLLYTLKHCFTFQKQAQDGTVAHPHTNNDLYTALFANSLKPAFDLFTFYLTAIWQLEEGLNGDNYVLKHRLLAKPVNADTDWSCMFYILYSFCCLTWCEIKTKSLNYVGEKDEAGKKR